MFKQNQCFLRKKKRVGPPFGASPVIFFNNFWLFSQMVLEFSLCLLYVPYFSYIFPLGMAGIDLERELQLVLSGLYRKWPIFSIITNINSSSSIWERAVLTNSVRAEPRKFWTKMDMKRSKKRALDLSLPPFCTKFRHDSHSTNGFANYGPRNFELFLVRAGKLT